MQGLEKLKELADKLPAAVKANAQALVQKMGETIEGIGDKPIEWRPANLKVVQATTDRSKLPKNTGIGSVLIGEEVQEQPFKIIPLRMWTTRQKWSADRDNTKLECWSPDGEIGFTLARDCKGCPHQKFDTTTNRSECNKTKTVLAITADLGKIFNVNFSKTAYQNGMAFEDLMKKAGVAPYKRIYTMKTGTHAKYKNVEALTVESEPKLDLDAATVEFMAELYRVMSEDRNKTLALIRDLVAARKTQNAVPGLPGPADEDGVIAMPSTPQALEAEVASIPKYEL